MSAASPAGRRAAGGGGPAGGQIRLESFIEHGPKLAQPAGPCSLSDNEHDTARLRELRAVLDETFKTNLAAGRPATASPAAAGHAATSAVDGNGDTYWTPADGVIQAALEVDLGRPVTFDRAMLQEMIATGQRVERFKLEAWNGAGWKEFVRATTIGYKRLMKFPAVTASKVRLTILDARDCPTIREFGLFKASARENP